MRQNRGLATPAAADSYSGSPDQAHAEARVSGVHGEPLTRAGRYVRLESVSGRRLTSQMKRPVLPSRGEKLYQMR